MLLRVRHLSMTGPVAEMPVTSDRHCPWTHRQIDAQTPRPIDAGNRPIDAIDAQTQLAYP